jgi:hypothetical protein
LSASPRRGQPSAVAVALAVVAGPVTDGVRPGHPAGEGPVPAVVRRFRREPDPGRDRVIVTLDGKFLPYQW